MDVCWEASSGWRYTLSGWNAEGKGKTCSFFERARGLRQGQGEMKETATSSLLEWKGGTVEWKGRNLEGRGRKRRRDGGKEDCKDLSRSRSVRKATCGQPSSSHLISTTTFTVRREAARCLFSIHTRSCVRLQASSDSTRSTSFSHHLCDAAQCRQQRLLAPPEVLEAGWTALSALERDLA